MKTLIQIQSELEHLKEIRGCYNHFLTSYEASKMPITNAYVQLNRTIINKEINALYLEIDKVKSSIVHEVKVTVRETHVPTPEFIEAITHFNNNKNYTITE